MFVQPVFIHFVVYVLYGTCLIKDFLLFTLLTHLDFPLSSNLTNSKITNGLIPDNVA